MGFTIKVNEILKDELRLNLSGKNNLLKKKINEWDSLKHISIVAHLEMSFGVFFEPEEIVQMNSTEEIVKILKKKGLN